MGYRSVPHGHQEHNLGHEGKLISFISNSRLLEMTVCDGGILQRLLDKDKNEQTFLISFLESSIMQ